MRCQSTGEMLMRRTELHRRAGERGGVAAHGAGAAAEIDQVARRRAGLRKFTQCRPQTRGAQQCLSRYWFALALPGSGLSRQWSFPIFNLRSADSRQSIQASKQTFDRCVPPKVVSPCCRNTASGEGRRNRIRRGYAISAMTGASAAARASARTADARQAASRASGVATALILLIAQP